MIDPSLIALALAAVLTVALIVLWVKQSKLRAELEEKDQQLKTLNEELKALFSGAAGVGSHLARLENQVSSLTDRQEQMDVRDPTTQNYNLAIDLVHQGAGVEELMRQCGLLMEEAELLVRLHGGQEESAAQESLIVKVPN